MATSSNLFAGAVNSTSGTTWATTTNATGTNNATVATYSTSTSGAVGFIILDTFGAQADLGSTIPASVDQVAVTVWGFVNTVARWTSMQVSLWDGTTQLGTTQTFTLTTTTTNSQTFNFTGVTWANLANLRVRVTGTKTGTQAGVMSVDAARVVVTYTPLALGDPVGATDAASAVVSASRGVSDTVSVTDGVTADLVRRVSVNLTNPKFFGTFGGYAASTTSFDATFTTADGECLYICVATTAGVTATAPGWSLESTVTSVGSNLTLQVLSRRVVGSLSSATVTLDAASPVSWLTLRYAFVVADATYGVGTGTFSSTNSLTVSQRTVGRTGNDMFLALVTAGSALSVTDAGLQFSTMAQSPSGGSSRIAAASDFTVTAPALTVSITPGSAGAFMAVEVPGAGDTAQITDATSLDRGKTSADPVGVTDSVSAVLTPGGGTPQTAFDRTDYGLTLGSDTTRLYTLTTEFSASQSAPLSGIWFYSAPGATALPSQCGVFRVSDHALIASNLSPSWSGAAGSGWVKCAFDGSVTLTANTSYKVAVYQGGPDTSNDWYCAVGNFFANDITRGIFTLPRTSIANVGNGAFFLNGSGLTYPNQQFNSTFYGVDVEVLLTPMVTPADAVGVTDSVSAVLVSGSATSIWGQTPTPSNSGDSGAYTLATAFVLSQDAPFTGIWFYSPAGATSLPTWAGLWRVSDQSSIAFKNTTTDGTLTWSGPAGSGWVKATFDGSVTLTTGVYYKASVYHPNDGSNWYAYTAHYFDAADVVNGIITAPHSTAGVTDNGTFHDVEWGYPATMFNNPSYWVDVEVTPATGGTPYAGAPADAVGITDAATDALDGSRTSADPVGVTDSALDALASQRTATDPVGVTDAATSAQALARTQADSVAVTDAAADALDGVRTVADPVGVSDSATSASGNARSQDDLVGVTDSVSAQLSVVTTQSPADPVGVQDAVVTVASAARQVGDPVGVADAATTALDTQRTLTDPVAATDSVAAQVGVNQTVTDPVAVSDALTQDRSTALSDAVGASDTAAPVQALTRAQGDAVGATDALTLSRSATVTEAVAVTDTASVVRVATTTVTDQVDVSDSVSAQLLGASTASLVEPVGITDDATRSLDLVRSASDPVAVSDTVALAAARILPDPVAVTDAVSVIATRAVTITDAVTATDVASASLTSALATTTTDTVPVTDTVTADLARVATSDLTDTVPVTDTATAATDADRPAAEQVDVTDAVTVVMYRVVDVADLVQAADDVAYDYLTAALLDDGVTVADAVSAALTIGVRIDRPNETHVIVEPQPVRHVVPGDPTLRHAVVIPPPTRHVVVTLPGQRHVVIRQADPRHVVMRLTGERHIVRIEPPE